jgi:hypothetical protein
MMTAIVSMPTLSFGFTPKTSCPLGAAGGESPPEYQTEFCTVAGIERETADCVRVDFDSGPSVGFPVSHWVGIDGEQTPAERLENVRERTGLQITQAGGVWRVTDADGAPLFQSRDREAAESMLPAYAEIQHKRKGF